MRAFAMMMTVLGLVLILGAGTAVALREFNVPVPTLATLIGSDTPGTTAVPDAAPAPPPVRPDFTARYSTIERADLRPPYPASTDYTPTVHDVTTLRLLDGVTPRRVSLYDGGTGDTARPVILLLHGAGRDELSMIDMWDDTADAHGLLLVSLKSNGGAWDAFYDDTPTINRALELAAERYPIDRSRIFLFGHSSGSVYAQLLANRAEGPWLAVAGHAGYVPANMFEPRENAPAVRHYLGSSDGIFAIAPARESAQALADAGHRSELLIIPGHTHWFYLGGPRIAEDAWIWFDSLTATP